MGASAVCIVIVLLSAGRGTEQSKEAMRSIHAGFVKVVNECKHQLNLSENILADLFHFWKLEYELLNRDTGCMIICMSKKLDIIDVSGKLQHGSAKEFALTHGAEEDVASKLVVTLHECEKANEGNEDDCLRALETAKCFRTRVHELNWTPKVEYIVEEILTEI